MSHLFFALGWAVVGGAVGGGLNYLTRRLARFEEIEFKQSQLDMFLMPALAALLFFLFALQLGAERLLFIDSVLIAILVQVLAFDLKTRYILDLVMFPSWVIALALATLTVACAASASTGRPSADAAVSPTAAPVATAVTPFASCISFTSSASVMSSSLSSSGWRPASRTSGSPTRCYTACFWVGLSR